MAGLRALARRQWRRAMLAAGCSRLRRRAKIRRWKRPGNLLEFSRFSTGRVGTDSCAGRRRVPAWAIGFRRARAAAINQHGKEATLVGKQPSASLSGAAARGVASRGSRSSPSGDSSGSPCTWRRDFFFIAFMTFMFSYIVLRVVDRGMRHLSAERERAWLRSCSTSAVFAGTLLALIVVGSLTAPRLLEQGQRLAGWLSHVSPESEIARLLVNYVGPYEFKRVYGGPSDPQYRQGLQDFVKEGDRHGRRYFDFSNLESWLEGGFTRQFADSQRIRTRQQRSQEGTSSKQFEQWFLTEKAPQLKKKAQERMASGVSAESLDVLVRSAATDQPGELLRDVRRNPAVLAMLKKQWLEAPPQGGLADLADRTSAAYQKQFREFFEQRQRQNPSLIPYSFEQYVQLQHARRQGRHAFGEAWDKMNPSKPHSEASLRADFESTKEHELFENWWATSEIAKFIRSQVEVSGGSYVDRIERLLAALVNIPIELATAILLSFFICIDFPKLKRGRRKTTGDLAARRLRRNRAGAVRPGTSRGPFDASPGDDRAVQCHDGLRGARGLGRGARAAAGRRGVCPVSRADHRHAVRLGIGHGGGPVSAGRRIGVGA